MSETPGGPGAFTTEHLRRLAAPTLVLGAERDHLWRGAEAVAAARAGLPDCEAELMAGAHHVPSRRDADAALRRVMHFFEGRGLAPPAS